MSQKMMLFVGTYTNLGARGIYTCQMDTRSGKIEHLAVTEDIENPSFLASAPSGNHLYAVCETTDSDSHGAVGAYAINGDGTLTFLNRESTGGPGPCHLAVDSTGSHLIVANYAGGSVCVLPIETDGTLRSRSDFIQHQGSSKNVVRQREAHAHSVTIDDSNSRAYVCDLGMDKIVVYQIQHKEGRLVEQQGLSVVSRSGHGPRHFDFHPSGNYCYVINELGSTVAVYDYNKETGQMVENQIISTLPTDWTGASHTADIHVSPDGRFVYGSNRGHDSIAIFSVDPDTGLLSWKGSQPTMGETPRNFALSPDGRFLLVANQDSANVVTFSVDSSSGGLEYTGSQIEIPAPVCLKFRP